MRRVGIFIVIMLVFFGLGLRQVLAGCEVTLETGIDPETGLPWWSYYDGCGNQWNYCPSGEYRAPNGQCYPIGDGGTQTGGGGGWEAGCPGPVNCAENAVDPNSYSDSFRGGFKFDDRCDLGNAGSQYYVCDDSGCNNWYYRIHACCPAGQTAQQTGNNYTDQWWNELPEAPNTCYGSAFWTNEYIPPGYETPLDRRTDYQCTCTRYDENWNCIPAYQTCINTSQILCRHATRVYGCVSTCTSTAPTNLTVTQGASATSATLSWRSGTGGSSQSIYVGTNQTSVNNNCSTGGCLISGASVSPFTANTNYSYPVTGMTANTTYYFRVVTYENSSCIQSTTTSYTTPDVSLSGRVYLDTNNNCSTSNPWSLGGLSVGVANTAYSGSVSSDGRFGFYGGTSSPISLVLSGYSGSYVPSTATGCNAGATLTSVTNPSSTNYFYLTPRREAWWQAVGGSVYASGNVRSELPSAAINMIESGAGGGYGALMRASGSVDTGAGSVSDAGYSAQTRYKGKTMNYDFFAAQMGVTPSTVSDWGTNTITEPTTQKDWYYLEPTGGNPAMIAGLSITAGESYIVFVDGDLRIAGNITVEEGGFLALIVNGSIYVSPAVQTIHGLYVIDGTLITETNGGVDVAANFEGSVVAWSGVNLGRDLVGSNLTSPGESFTYRPDLLTNMPDAMKVFALKWEEVVPGTFGQ